MSVYPGALDTQIDRTDGVDYITAADIEAVHASAVAVQAELGLDPAGASATVRARLDALDTTVAGKAASAHAHAAGDITSGTLASARLPFTGTPDGSRFLRDDLSWQVPPGGGGAFVTPEIIVCSVDMPTGVKDAVTAAGGYVCDGTADQVQINAAIDQAAALQSRNAGMPVGAQQRGMVRLTGGRFNTSGSILHRTAVWLKGMGWLTQVRAVGMGAAHMIALAAPDDHLCRVSDLWLDGNFASGGTGGGIVFDMTGSGNTSDYPDSNPDSNHLIHDLLLTGFSNGTTRDGIWLGATGTANNRGNIVDRVQVRSCSRDGIVFDGASDSYISNTHVGTIGRYGHWISGGNTKVSNAKSFYCDDTGFLFESGRHTAIGLEAQDNLNGITVNAADFTGSAWNIDNFSTAGLTIGASGVQLTAFTVHQRAGGRYATGATGLLISGTRTDLSLVGRVNPTSITTKISGTPSSRSFMRVSDGTTLVSVG